MKKVLLEDNDIINTVFFKENVLQYFTHSTEFFCKLFEVIFYEWKRCPTTSCLMTKVWNHCKNVWKQCSKICFFYIVFKHILKESWFWKSWKSCRMWYVHHWQLVTNPKWSVKSKDNNTQQNKAKKPQESTFYVTPIGLPISKLFVPHCEAQYDIFYNILCRPSSYFCWRSCSRNNFRRSQKLLRKNCRSFVSFSSFIWTSFCWNFKLLEIRMLV